MYRRVFKRWFDFALSLMVIVFLAPLFFIIFLLVKIDSEGPLFFFQERLGQNGETFKIYKFRTMTHKDRVSNKEIVKGDPDVTKVGYFLRRFKLDELPQILNILKGDMSLVGPRPGLPNQLADFNENAKFRLLVKPGMTGLAQVNGNIFLSWEERWKYDRKYVENLSVLLDLKILFKTVSIVLKGEERFINKPDV